MSIGFDGSPADNWNARPDVSASGRYVAWDSYATNLIADDTNGGLDVFLRDRRTDTTERVSVTSQETQANGESTSAAMSADGRFVVFESGATNLSEVDDNGTVDVFLRDRLYGTTELVSIGLDGTAGDELSLIADVSDDGRYVAFVSRATDLVSDDTNEVADVFVRDRMLDTTTRVSVATGGEQAGGCGCFMIAISGNGRHVAFDSEAADLVEGDTNGKYDVFVHHLKTGVTTRVSVPGGGGQGNFASIAPAISRRGDVVGFQSGATNLVADDTNDAADVFVRVR
jgi:Tol biopolymer transport system component